MESQNTSVPFFLPLYLFVLFGICASHSFAADYYWVGGNGNWSDIQHWVTTSGGSVQHTSVPSTADNVYFDENSFDAAGQMVTIDFPIVFCRTMDWTGTTNSPGITMPETSILNIAGSLVLLEDMQWDVEGDVQLVGTEAGFTIHTAGHSILRRLVFDAGAEGEWTLTSPLQVDSMIYFIGGNWVTDDFNIGCERLWLLPGTQSNVDFGQSVINIWGFTENKGRYPENSPLWVRTDHLSLDASETTFEIPAPLADIQVIGRQPANLGHVEFQSPTGIAYVNDLRVQYTGPSAPVSFESLSFNSNARIGRIAAAGDLTFSAGKSYTLLSNQEIDILTLDAIGTCAEPISIYTETSGQQTTFLTAEEQELTYANIRGIAIQGSTYRALESVDLGNNDGWDFEERTPGALYWIGGNGVWSDPAHWSSSSGGPPSGCIPSAADDVFFDQNSFSGNNNFVMIDIDDALCRSMTWTANGLSPLLRGDSDHKIHVFGSLEFQTDLQIEFTGDFWFESRDSGQTITSNGVAIPNNAYFNGTGEYRLLDALEINDSLVFNTGSLVANDQNLIVESFISPTEEPRTLDLGSSHITLRTLDMQYDHLQWRIHSNEFELDAGTSIIEFLGTSGGTFEHNDMLQDYQYHHVLFNNNYAAIIQYGNPASRLRFVYVEANISGEFRGALSKNVLRLSPGFTYTFGRMGDLNYFEIDTLIADGDCDQFIRIESYREGRPVIMTSGSPYTVRNVILHDIDYEGQGRESEALQSLLYDSDGWIQTDTAESRQLYWVGDAGQWTDRSHWSLNSGGPGGECIPTPVDDVFFDENSFSISNQRVENHQTGFEADCRDLTWTNEDVTNHLSLGSINVYGSAQITDRLEDFYIGRFDLRGDNVDQTIDLNGNMVGALRMQGAGSWELLSDLGCSYMALNRGTLDLGSDNEVYVQWYVTSGYNALDATLIGGSSHLMVENNGFYYSGMDLDLDAQDMLLEFLGPYCEMRLSFPLDFHHVLFSNQGGQSHVETGYEFNNDAATFNKLEFRNNAVIFDTNECDTLLFTPGHTYTLESGRTQTINEHWRIRGNNCGRIELRASVPGMKAETFMSMGEVDGDFIQMTDQRATGGAIFRAGSNSTNVNNSNEGWLFEERSSFVDYGILGEDIVLCEQDSLVLNEDESIGASSYRWQDGTTGPTFEVNAPGLYFLEATFEAGGSPCVFRDSIRILEPEDFQLDLGDDLVLCDGDSATIGANIDLVGIEYQWDHGPEAPAVTVGQPGIYRLAATLSGCVTSDSIELVYVEIPELDTSQQLMACEGEVLTLDVTIPGATYQWSSGETTSSIQVTSEGLYGIVVIANGCEASDSFDITFVQPPVYDLGPDSTVCVGTTYTLDASVVGAQYLWDDGSTTPNISFMVVDDTVRYVDVGFGNCITRDSILLSVKPLPELDMSPDQTICPNTGTTVSAMHTGDSIRWNTGHTSYRIEPDMPGEYTATTFLDGCSTEGTVSVDFYQTAFVSLPEDTTICDDRTLMLDVRTPNASYQWSTGESSAQIEVSGGLIAVTVDDGNCTFSDSILVETRSCVFFSAYSPNAFTPNGDGVNDGWSPLLPAAIQIVEYDLQIFDRWGGAIFSTDDPAQSWDGKVAGELMPGGVYLGSVYIEYVDDDGPGTYQEGVDFTLLR